MYNSEQFVDTAPYTFKRLISRYEKFQIPNFQRSYSWKNRQFTDLFSSIIENREEYFIGNIVCLKPTSVSDNRLVIIDGQQRITSISILLIALRDEVNSLKKSDEAQRLKTKIQQYIVGTDLDIGISPESDFKRLSPGKQNLVEVYNKLINEEVDFADRNLKRKYDKNQLGYLRNYELARKLTSDYTKGSLKKIEELINKTISLTFIAIVCAKEDDVYNLFEGLNSKGLGLSVADLLKNALLRTAKDFKIEDEIEETWLQIEEYFEQTDTSLFPKFLRHQWISENGYISNSELYESIKGKKLSNTNKEDLLAYVNGLLIDAKFYLGVIKLDQVLVEFHEEGLISDSLTKFRLLNNLQVYELILAYQHKFNKKDGFLPKHFTNALDKLWNFAFRARFVSINPSDYERKFAAYCDKIATTPTKDMLKNNMDQVFYKDLSDLVISSEQFIKNFSEQIGYDSDKPLVGYILNRLIEQEDRDVTTRKPSIEHIVPQKPKEWGLLESDVRDYVHSIGNLTILSSPSNNKAQNKSMEYKCEHIYSKDKLEFNKKVLALKDDFIKNPKETVSVRSIEIAKNVEKIFRI